ncbi:quinone-dependent dihydroorotate dehydrogenase [Natrinema gelatinilyticum]|uniref:quinone-dependent dihydroorotate dehydrogenase n=1 Tax=Natrinema gelatinilyticum TaxID=2961571 RepID=UPI0020C2593A|nr:quinone-dependent dihydroorotate dehydrogenase [Natrinema gelatinilyticum]
MTLYETVRPALFALPAETAHNLGKQTMGIAQSSETIRRAIRYGYKFRHPMLEVERFGLTFPTPIGVAAGFDKNGEVMHCLSDLGFGFAEVGTVTPYPQPGNERPRLFRLPEDEAMINRLAFNSQGTDRVRQRMATNGTPPVPVAVNVGKMNTSNESEAIEDYRRVVDRLSEYADYFVLNVSCPNTPEEYDEQSPEHLREIFTTLEAENDEGKPLLVKVGPDSQRGDLDDLVDIVEEFAVDGIVATNTTTDHDDLTGKHRDEWGGVSGTPLESAATATVATLAELTDLPIIGVGGVDDAESAYRKIRAGACLVQAYTGFVYRGPSLAREINEGLVRLLREDGFDTIDDAIGADLD